MKNYTLTVDESENFILGYSIKDENIVIRYGDGNFIFEPYSVDNEKKILNIMKQQILDYKKYQKYQIAALVKTINGILANLIFAGFSFDILNITSSIILKIIFLILVVYFSLNGFISTIDIPSQFEILNDIKKNKEFIEFEKKINSNLSGHNLPSINLNDAEFLNRNDLNVLKDSSNFDTEDYKKVLSKVNTLIIDK